MAFEIPGLKNGTQPAGADLRLKQYHGVKLNAAAAVVAAGAGEAIAGVLQNKPNTGEACERMMTGVTKGVAGAIIAAGADVQVDANGQFITKAAGIGVGRHLGQAACAVGDVISIELS